MIVTLPPELIGVREGELVFRQDYSTGRRTGNNINAPPRTAERWGLRKFFPVEESENIMELVVLYGGLNWLSILSKDIFGGEISPPYAWVLRRLDAQMMCLKDYAEAVRMCEIYCRKVEEDLRDYPLNAAGVEKILPLLDQIPPPAAVSPFSRVISGLLKAQGYI